MLGQVLPASDSLVNGYAAVYFSQDNLSNLIYHLPSLVWTEKVTSAVDFASGRYYRQPLIFPSVWSWISNKTFPSCSFHIKLMWLK